MTKNFTWLKNGGTYRHVSSGVEIKPSINCGIYVIDMDVSGFFLKTFQDEFTFPFKIYDLDEGFIDHVMYTFNNTTTNLGILLSGTKGTGKTIIGKIIANKMKLPVILVQDAFEDKVFQFLSEIDFPCILFFDEFEKNFKDSDEILSLMDGVYSGNTRKVFILTTNTDRINSCLKSRPSRIRYVKHFDNLSYNALENYLNDNLNDISKKDEIIKFVSSLEISTIDILKIIVEEINLHKCGVDDIKDIINVTTANYVYDAYSYEVPKYCKFDINDFKELIRKIGTKDSDGCRIGYYDLGLNYTTICSKRPIKSLIAGDTFDFLTISEVYEDYLKCTNSKGCVVWLKVNNPDTSNDLYRFIL